MRKFLLATTAVVGLLFAVQEVEAQQTTQPSYPFLNPSYIPTAVTAAGANTVASTATLPAYIVFSTQSIGTSTVTISGTYTGLVATIQGAVQRSGTVVWTNLSINPVGSAGGQTKQINKNGSYQVNSAGFSQIRVAISALASGSVVADYAGSGAGASVLANHERKATFRSAFVTLTPAATATDIIVLPGNATTTVRVTRASCLWQSTATGTANFYFVKRTTANTGGTSATGSVVALDSNDIANASTPVAYSVNPTTLGASAGTVEEVAAMTYNLGTLAFIPTPTTLTFGATANEEVVLRGAAQSFAISNNGAAVVSGGLLSCTLEWTEE